MSDDFWEQPERVERFAGRDPDHRLADLVEIYDDPAATRVLDVGCAGGRNTEFLARGGFDIHALDAAAAMVERTRERVAEVLGPEEARRRVVRGVMDDLSRWPDAHFHLVVSLGVHHGASDLDEWHRAAAETARVLKPGGRLLFNQFTPDVDLTGDGVESVPGEPHVYDGFPAGRAVLMEADALDAAWAGHGLRPEVPSETVRVELEEGKRRVSVNGLYERATASP